MHKTATTFACRTDITDRFGLNFFPTTQQKLQQCRGHLMGFCVKSGYDLELMIHLMQMIEAVNGKSDQIILHHEWL